MQVLDIAGLRNTSGSFRSALAETALSMGLNPSYLAAVMAIETGRTYSPSIQNPDTRATGLIQFMPLRNQAIPGMTSVGVTTSDLARMSNVKQLEYVKRFFRPYLSKIRPDVVGDYYLAVFMPAFIGSDPSKVLFSSGETGYAQNVGLDRNGDGLITVGDVVSTVEGVVASARQRPSLDVPVGASLLAWTFGGLVAVLVGTALYERRRDVKSLIGKYAPQF